MNRTKYWREDLKVDFKEFIQSCIHFILSQNGERVPRPLSTALHGERPNDFEHANFIYMGPAEGSNVKYILIVTNDIISYTWLFPSNNVDSDAATTAIGRWITCFGEMDWLVAD